MGTGAGAQLEYILETLSFGIELVSALILVAGSLVFLWTLGSGLLTPSVSVTTALQRGRLKLGTYILAALEFLIVADILFTIVHRTLDDVIVLAIVAGVRTVVSYFLGKEIEALSQEESEALGLRRRSDAGPSIS
ncbi:DUF1622 domain-containing protein [Henriciella marina]|uniref:DUF1622 domain-containing protein n=1 Tax=Henriciella marina TaxID=453851 RepID=A0ABT4LTD2_9PROT|nr:DUF1622 domain-containing protein [Henriciella marina]MCZ4297624.1 DUF1622 domain-containing protein [Henriciella marina]